MDAVEYNSKLKALLSAHEEIGRLRQKEADEPKIRHLEQQLKTTSKQLEKLSNRVCLVVDQVKSIGIDISTLFDNEIPGFTKVDGTLNLFRTVLMPIISDLHIIDDYIQKKKGECTTSAADSKNVLDFCCTYPDSHQETG